MTRWTAVLVFLAACGGNDRGNDESSAGVTGPTSTVGTSAVTSAEATDGSDEATDSTADTTATEAGDTGDSTDTTGSTGDGDGDGDGDAPIPVCLTPCSTAADCAQPTPAFDEDNYSCEDGGCVYTGCNSEDECASLGQVCRPSPGLDYDTCLIACSTPTDCDFGGGLAFDADNYECQDGGCVYTGCNSDTECQDTDPANVCADFSALGGIPSCVRSCSVADDCSQGSAPFDADNYSCDEGICTYTGCNSDAECMSLPTPLVCR